MVIELLATIGCHHQGIAFVPDEDLDTDDAHERFWGLVAEYAVREMRSHRWREWPLPPSGGVAVIAEGGLCEVEAWSRRRVSAQAAGGGFVAKPIVAQWRGSHIVDAETRDVIAEAERLATGAGEVV